MKKQINEIKRMQQFAGIITESEYQESVENEAFDQNKIDNILKGTYKKPEAAIDPKLQKMATILDTLVSKSFDYEKLENILNALGPIKPELLRKTIDLMKDSNGFDLNDGEPSYNLIVDFSNYDDDSKGVALSWDEKKWNAG